jgi:hypothetical protein
MLRAKTGAHVLLILPSDGFPKRYRINLPVFL